VWRAFGGLKVRPKLVLLHNLFFAVLTVSVYFAVIPVFSEHIDNARDRELFMAKQIFGAKLPVDNPVTKAGLKMYQFREGTWTQLGLSAEGQTFLREHPDAVWQQGPDTLFRVGAHPGSFQRIHLSPESYRKALRQARFSLFIVLGVIYMLAVAVMEFVVMPRYVYQPLRLMLDADEATQQDDRSREMIDEKFILHDEIGQIMRSRNAATAKLRRHEDQLAEALQKLEEQDRLVSLGLLSTSVAHELNTPLAVLQGSIEKLCETTRDAHTQERLARMLRVTQRLRKISESLVDFARVRKQATEPVALRPLITESWNLVAIDEKASAVTFQNAVGELQSVLGNADRLIQVFVNLLRNALLAVTANGVIQVDAKLIQKGGRSWVCCRVLDNGPGIPPHILPNLFEAFVSTRLDARGTGLGLTVAEGIVTQHGGVINASNRAEGGASIEVLLPSAA
jgi:signal transduction histidine kinase